MAVLPSQIVTTEFVQTLQKVIFPIVNKPETYMGQKYLPSINMPVEEIYVDSVEATGGLSPEHVLGTNPKIRQRTGSTTLFFKPGAYREEKVFDERDILFLRKLGENDRSRRGIEQQFEIALDDLNRRMEARIEKLRWDTIFTGAWSYMGQTISYGIPTANTALPVGAVWSLDSINANPSANPLQDIRYWMLGGYPTFRKYKVSKMIMNPNTVRWILDNPNTQTLVRTYFSAENFGAYDINKTVQLAVAGAPEIVVYDGWYQSESVDSFGQITVSDAIFMIPDGRIYFEVSNFPGGAQEKIGEFVLGSHLAEGTISSPGYGKFLVVEDNTKPGTKGGPGNPYISMVAGFLGGVKLDRFKDVITADVL